MIAIIGAMRDEIEYLEEKIYDLKVESFYHIDFYCGKIGNKNIVLVQSGVGKTNAGLLMGLLVGFYEVDLIINVGVCGGVKDKVDLFDLVVVDKYFYGDVELPKDEYEYGRVSKAPRYFELDRSLKKTIKKNFSQDEYKFANCYTSDTFVDRDNYPKVKAIIDEHFKNDNIAIFDMESTAFAHGAYLLDIPFVSVRAISDLVPETSYNEYSEHYKKAIVNSGEFVLKLVLSL